MKSIYTLLCLILLSYGLFAQTYKVMTYNIRYDNPTDGENQWSKRKDFLSNQIQFYEPDIFGIQEGLHHQVTYLDSVLVDYDYVGTGRDDGKTKGEYSAIYYNTKKFKPIESATFWLSETPEQVSVGWDAAMERICTYALFKDLKTNEKFWVFNTHFDHIGHLARAESVKLIIKTIKTLNKNNMPVVITGDFNLTPESEPIQQLSKYYNDCQSVCISKPFGPTGTFNGFKFSDPVKNRIDYIFTSKNNIKVLKYAILSDSKNCRYPSDHFPVFIQISFRP